MTDRLARVAENIKQTIGMMLEKEIKDPRIGFVTITGVEVSPDLRHARVFYSTLAKGGRREGTEEGLESAKGYIRSELGKRLHMKRVPDVEWRYDTSVEAGQRIAELLRKIKGSEGAS